MKKRILSMLICLVLLCATTVPALVVAEIHIYHADGSVTTYEKTQRQNKKKKRKSTRSSRSNWVQTPYYPGAYPGTVYYNEPVYDPYGYTEIPYAYSQIPYAYPQVPYNAAQAQYEASIPYLYPSANAPANGGTAVAPNYGQPATQPNYGQPATQPNYGQPAAQPNYGQPATQPNYGQPATQPNYGQPATQPNYGQSATQPNYGQPVTQPAAQSGNGLQPASQPATQPATRPNNSQPVTQPAAQSGNGLQPASQPATQPAAQPAGGQQRTTATGVPRIGPQSDPAGGTDQGFISNNVYGAQPLDYTGNSFVYVKTNSGGPLNVRTRPNPDATVLGQLRNNDKVEILEYIVDGTWAAIMYKGMTSYVPSRYLVSEEVNRDAPVSPSQENATVPDLYPAGQAPSGNKPGVQSQGAPAGNAASGNSASQFARTDRYLVTTHPSRVGGWVELRWEPSTKGQVIRYCFEGETMEVIGQNDTWLQVMDPNGGYVGYLLRTEAY